ALNRRGGGPRREPRFATGRSGGNTAPQRNALAGRNADEIGGAPDEMLLQIADRSADLDDFPHHFDEPPAAFLVQGSRDAAGEIMQIDRAAVLFGRLRDQLRRARIVELEAALYHRMEVGALVCQFAALDARDTHEQGRGSEAQTVVAEIVLRAGRGG